MSFALSDQQRKTLELICETINPSLPPERATDDDAIFANSASHYAIVDHLEERLANSTESQQAGIAKLLRLINLPFVCWFFTYTWVPFRFLRLKSRVDVLRYWCDHRDTRLRTFYQMVKRAALFMSYSIASDVDDEGRDVNPTWASINYSGVTPLIAQDASSLPIRPREVSDFTDEIECDYLIVGSGAGGGVMAAELAERGYRILIVEKGELVAPSELGNSELGGMSRYFDGGGALATQDLGITVLSGSTVGGGTTVNWMTCLDPPKEILHYWVHRYGFLEVGTERFQSSLTAVRQRLNVTDEHSQLNGQNQMLLKGCEHFGFRTQTIERNAKDCGDCGYCGFGCRAGAKQDVRQTYLADAMRLGAELLPRCEIERIERIGSTATHAVAKLRRPGGEVQELNIKFRAAVVACGAVQSAALLLRSRFKNAHIGANLKLHPTTAVAAFYDQPILPWSGAPQTVVCDEFENLDGQQHGVRLEVAPCHPGFGAMALAWDGPMHHKRLMQRLDRMANTIVIARDKGSGKVTLSPSGQPLIDYQLDPLDAKHLLFGAERALEIHRAAGAKTILGPHQRCLEIDREMDDQSFNRMLHQMNHRGVESNRLSLFSAHQMSTVRIADSPLRGALDRKGRCFDAQNVYVCDASVFPTSVGVNPMITVMALSHMLAQTIRDEGFSVYDF